MTDTATPLGNVQVSNDNTAPASPAVALGEGAVLSIFATYPSVANSRPPHDNATQSLFAKHDCPKTVKTGAKFVRFELPRFNTDVENGVRSLDHLLQGIRHAIDFNSLNTLAWNDPRNFRLHFDMLKIVGFAVSSAERHGQHAGAAPGETLARLEGAENLLLSLGDLTGLPPRDNIYTFWAGNPGHELSFTGSPEEAYFNFAVAETVRVQNRALAILDSLRGTKPIGAQDVESVRLIDQDLRYLRDEVYRGYFPVAKNIRLGGMTPDFFLKRMRPYLRSYPVGGHEQDAPNATYVPTFPAMDFALGVCDAPYRERVESRFKWMSREDRATLTTYMQSPSVLETCYLRAGAGLEQDEAGFAKAIGRNAVQREFFQAFANMLTSWTTLAGTHFGLITNYVERPGKAMNAEERKLYRTEVGVSGSGLADTRAILDMRSAAPLFQRLQAAVAFIGPADGKQEV